MGIQNELSVLLGAVAAFVKEGVLRKAELGEAESVSKAPKKMWSRLARRSAR